MIELAIKRLVPDIAFTMVDQDYDSIVVYSGHTLPTQAEIDAIMPAVVVSENAKAEIARLENLETPRRLAEAVLTVEGKTWLEANRALIAVERAKL